MSSPARILVVDDSVFDVELLRFALNDYGEKFELEVLPDGEAALEYVSDHRHGRRAHEPCVILLDLNLPRHSGLAVLQAIRETPALTHIQVVVLSGSASPRDRADVGSLGAIFRQKPMDLAQFAVLSREVLDLCKGALKATA